MQEYVAGFLFRKGKTEVALVEKQKPAWQKGKYNGIGGKIEHTDNHILAAMIREFKEETGETVTDWKLFCELAGKDWVVYFFKSFEGDDKNLQTIEEERILWCEINDELFTKGLPNLKWLIPLAMDEDNHYAEVVDNGAI